MGRSGVTINDVAARSGVSKVTVSYVLNNREGRIKISDSTKRQVMQACRDLGYHPNALARGLARKQTDTLTVVMQYVSVFSEWSGFICEVMRGTSDKACELGFDLMLHTKNPPSFEAEVFALTDGRADGALLLRDYDDPLVRELANRGFPYMQIFSHSPDPSHYSVDCDNVRGSEMATEYLLSLGHRRVGHVYGSSHSAASRDRHQGYLRAMANAGIHVEEDWCMQITFRAVEFGEFVQMMKGPRAPTALVCWSDDVAARSITVLRDTLNLKVPEDVSVIGYDSTALCESTTPRLTSVAQPIYEMAACGVEMLVHLIREGGLDQPQRCFQPHLDLRDSCAAAKS